jgi:hypothetical protein
MGREVELTGIQRRIDSRELAEYSKAVTSTDGKQVTID